MLVRTCYCVICKARGIMPGTSYGHEENFSNAPWLWVTHTTGETAACPTQSRLGVCSLSKDCAWCLLTVWRLLELPRQEGTLAKGMAVELGLCDMAFASESSQWSHLPSYLA